MNRWLCSLFLLVCLSRGTLSQAQGIGTIAYSDTFVVSTSYCPGSSQYDQWGVFRSQLDTTLFRILRVTMKGSYSSTGRVCNDSFIARKIASALKNPGTTSFTVSCNGNTWVVGYPGSCISAGCPKISDNVGIAADGATNACACLNPSWQIRPTIGNINWGGVNTISCNPPPSQRMTLEFGYRLYDLDASITNVQAQDVCTNPNRVVARLRNSGSKTLDSCRVHWRLNGTFQSMLLVRARLKPGRDTLIELKSGQTYNPRTNYDLRAWCSRPNGAQDQFTLNDTFKLKFTFLGTPKIPDARDTQVCGTGRHWLKGKPANPGDSLIWYASRSSNLPLGYGNPFLSPVLSKGTYMLYIASAGQLDQAMLESNFSGGNQQAGFMLDLKSNQGVVIDSLGLNIGAVSGTSADIEVYTRDGTYSGFESNSSAWTLLGKYTVKSRGTGIATGVPARLTVQAGKTLGLYVQTTNAPSFYLQYGNGNFTYSNSEFQITTGAGIALNWGGTFAGRNGNIRFYYKRPVCVSDRDSMKVTVSPKPNGAALIKGSPFNSPDPGSQGTKAFPDITWPGNVLNYELQPPSGYTNTDYGKTWTLKRIQVMSQSGRNITKPDTAFTRPGAGNALFRIKTDKSLEDSLIIIRSELYDLSGTSCDSQVLRYLYVAPKPTAGFVADAVCQGEPTIFRNTSKISKGLLKYRWNFGTGDSSNAFEPIYVFQNAGLFPVHLKVISAFGIEHDTLIRVLVREIPTVRFKVTNACEGDSLEFLNSTLPASGSIKYMWDFGDGMKSSRTSPKHLYKNAGDYVVTLHAVYAGCTGTLSRKANQFVRPKAAFSAAGNCTGTPVRFQNQTTIGLGENFGSSWSFGSSEGGNNEKDPEYTYTTSGQKTVRYVATSQFGCTDSAVRTIMIQPAPLASFSSGAPCNVKPVEFNNTTTEPPGISTSYIWSFGDGFFSSQKNPVHPYPETGKKTVRLTALGSNGCSTYTEKSMTILPQPIAGFEATDACVGDEVVFINKTKGSGLILYKWKFGDGDSSSQFSPVKRYKGNFAATYNVTLTALSPGGCSDALTLPLNIRETPNCKFTFRSAGTGGFEYIFTPVVTTYPFYQWTFEGGGNSNEVNPKFRFDHDGTFKVRVSMRNADGCTCEDTSQKVLVYHLGTEPSPTLGGIRIIPNPAKTRIRLSQQELRFRTGTIRINDLSGRAVMIFQAINPLEEWDISGLAPGIYIISLESEGHTLLCQKLAIEL